MAKSPHTELETIPNTELTERRYVYNGALSSLPQDVVPLRNKPAKRRKQSPLNIIAILFIVSVIIVLYIWNKISVNRLAVEVNDLHNQYQKVLSATEVVRADINKKSGLERIEKIAIGQLGLTYPKEQPVWFEVHDELINRTSQQRE